MPVGNFKFSSKMGGNKMGDGKMKGGMGGGKMGNYKMGGGMAKHEKSESKGEKSKEKSGY